MLNYLCNFLLWLRNFPPTMYKRNLTLTNSMNILLLVLILFSLSCEDSTGPGDDSPPLPDDAALYLSMDGTEAGLWILNANSLELIDSMITAPGVPWTIEFSPDHGTWYSCWGRSADYSLYSCNLQPLTVQNRTQFQYAKYALVKSYDEKYLIAYGYKGIDIFDRMSLSLLLQDTSSYWGEFSRITSSRKDNKIYYTWIENRQIVGFGIYDVNSLSITDTMRIFNNVEYPDLQDVDLVVSNDDKLLFFSAWNWTSGFSGIGSFFVIDITQKKIIKEFIVGAFSQLAISPDGQSVYISDPGGYLYNFMSSGKVWRYNVGNNTMDVLLNDLYFSDRITVAEDNRTLFITPVVSFVMDNGQKRAWVVKVDALKRQVINYYPVAYDSTGFFTNNPRNIRMGKYSINLIK